VAANHAVSVGHFWSVVTAGDTSGHVRMGMSVCALGTGNRQSVREGGSWFKDKPEEAVEGYLNELGADGWEIIHLDWRELERRMSFMGIAKRERQEP